MSHPAGSKLAGNSGLQDVERGTRNPELFVVHVASGREWRGGQRQVCYLARALMNQPGLRQLVATGKDTRLHAELAGSGVPVLPLAWGPAFDVRALLGLIRGIQALRRERPVLHAHDSHALTLAAIAAAGFGLPLVATRRVDFPIRNSWLWRRAHRVVAISEAVRQVTERSGIDHRRLVVVHSGIPLAPGRVEPIDLRRRLGLPAKTTLAVSVGALVPHKDYRTLIAAAELLRTSHPRLHWVIAGEGPLRPGLQRQIAGSGLERVVHLIGHVPDGREVIAGGDVFVVSSREEGLNTSVLDAMQLQVPVVSTDAGGLPEVLGAGAGLVVPREQPAALAEAVAGLLRDAVVKQRLIAAARAGMARFGSDQMAAGMLPVYHSVATRDP